MKQPPRDYVIPSNLVVALLAAQGMAATAKEAGRIAKTLDRLAPKPPATRRTASI